MHIYPVYGEAVFVSVALCLVSEGDVVILPFLAHLNTKRTIEWIAIVLAVVATVFHAEPNVVQTSMAFAVKSFSCQSEIL